MLKQKSIGDLANSKSTDNVNKISQGARKSNFNIGMGQKNSMQTSSKKAFEKLDKQQNNSKFIVPSSSTNMKASKNANWNLGYQTVNYVSTNTD